MDGIYALVPREQLEKLLRSLHAFTSLNVRMYDAEGSLLQAHGSGMTYCDTLKKNIFTHGECIDQYRNAGLRAQEIGEAYIFACKAQLNHIVYPLIYRSKLIASVLIGPFLMDHPDSTLISELADKYSLTPALSLELYDQSTQLQVIPPDRVDHLKVLIDHLFSPLIPSERLLLLQTQKKALLQKKINETIQIYKEGKSTPSLLFFYQKEKELLHIVKTGNAQRVKELLNELIGYALFSEGGNMDSMRARSIELTTLLSRVALEGGAGTEHIYDLNEHFLKMIYQEQSLDDLCLLLQSIIVSFMDVMFYQQDKGNPYIRKALCYISDHYHQPLDLSAVAEHVQLSPGYLSSLFRQVTGISFSEHLCTVRIEESKHLLLNTNYPLAQIALAVGFPDQSYYCKVFKRTVGLTPGQFRIQPSSQNGISKKTDKYEKKTNNR